MKQQTTNIRVAEQGLAQSDIEKKLSILIINTEESFVLVDTHFNIVTFNAAYEKQFTRLFNKSFTKGDSILQYSMVHSVDELEKIYQKVFAGEKIEKEVQLTYNGNPHTFIIKYKPALDELGNIFGAFVNTYDITDRVEALEKVKQSKENLKAIFENTSEGFILLDNNCIVKAFNSKTKKYTFFMSDNEMEVGKNLFEFVEPSRTELFKDIIAKVLFGETIQYDRPYQKENSSLVWIDFSITPVKENGDITGICIAIRDITQRVQNEVALTELYDKLNKRAEELSQSNAELEKFAYIASHDLQEPLRMVTSFMSRLEYKYSDQLDDKAKQYIHFAVDGAARMQKIILDLLEYSKIGKKEYKYEEIDVNNLMEEVLQLNTSIINEKNALVTWDKLPKIYGYKTPLLQLFHNVVNNSLKYQLADKKPLVKILVEEHIDHWQFSVHDNGIGIESQFLNKIFDMFQRLHQKEKYSGTGIGLAICKKIVESHEGKMWVESEEGAGSVFYFTIKKKIYNKFISE